MFAPQEHSELDSIRTNQVTSSNQPLILEPIKTKKYKLFFTAIASHLLPTCDFKAHVIESDVIGILTMEDINFLLKLWTERAISRSKKKLIEICENTYHLKKVYIENLKSQLLVLTNCRVKP